jgi:protein gp37
MSSKTSIEWTRGDDGTDGATWNPITGCLEVSEGCDSCYAKTFAERWRGTPGHYFENGFDVQLRPAKLAVPFTWRKPRRVFVNSMSDLFHSEVPDEYIANVFAVMAATPQHTYQVLTKRHSRMRSLLTSAAFGEQVWQAFIEFGDFSFGGKKRIQPEHWRTAASLLGETSGAPMRSLPNAHLGVSCESQHWAQVRIPTLLETPAAVRFVSAEPLLGPIDLRRLVVRGALLDALGGDVASASDGVVYSSTPSVLDWVIAGSESGRHPRPMDLDWVRLLRDQCAGAGTAFFFKQITEQGKKIPTPELDGRTWTQMPAAVAA